MKDLMRVIGMWQKSETGRGAFGGNATLFPSGDVVSADASYGEDASKPMKAATAGSRWELRGPVGAQLGGPCLAGHSPFRPLPLWLSQHVDTGLQGRVWLWSGQLFTNFCL